jgi:hypothetical protein
MMQTTFTSSVLRRLLTLALALATAAVLTGCSSGAPSAPAQTLGDTKSPAQLLRNTVAGRIAADAVDRIEPAQDRSLPCASTDSDPDGLLRSWHSSVGITLVDSVGTAEVVSGLVDSFVAEGWELGTYGGRETITLSREGSGPTIYITLPEGEAGNELGLEVEGPCVTTDGTDSLEVRELEQS